MKKKMSAYISMLSGNRFDILETIISTKYRKFLDFYWAVSAVSDDIAHVSYRISPESSLDIDITLEKGVKPSKFISHIKEQIGDSYDYSISYEKHCVFFSIMKDESGLL